MYSRYVSGILLKRYNSNVKCESLRNANFLSSHYKLHGRFKWCGQKMSIWLREQSIQVVRACTRQFEFIAAQRVRRSIQIFHLYTRLWDEVALKEFIKQWRRRVSKNTKDFLIGAVGIAMFNWETEKIPDREMYSYSKEIDSIHKLRELTVLCPECNLRLVIDVNQPGVKYCQCNKPQRATQRAQEKGIEWEPFLERQDMLMWRRVEKDSGGLYSYKIHATYDDVSADDFLQVQIDIDYRKKWDATAKQLDIIDTDPSPKEAVEGCSDIIYWEMIWPRMFANRDYVYQRRWLYDKSTGMIIIVSKGMDHPKAPNRPDTYRVQKYWSYMVIKPLKDFHEPGIEFGLTYFDDPGVNMPSALTSWVAMSGLPDYLIKMRQATRDYKSYKTVMEESEKSVSKSTTTMNSGENSSNEKLDNVDERKSKEKQEPGKEEVSCVPEITSTEDSEGNEATDKITASTDESSESSEEETIEDNSEADPLQDVDPGFLDYIYLAKLFA